MLHIQIQIQERNGVSWENVRLRRLICPSFKPDNKLARLDMFLSPNRLT